MIEIKSTKNVNKVNYEPLVLTLEGAGAGAGAGADLEAEAGVGPTVGPPKIFFSLLNMAGSV